MLKGNKIRFINEPPDGVEQNCRPRASLCNSVVRLAVYAEKDIKTGDELFFSYGDKYVIYDLYIVYISKNID
jgi:SET domain-containing protein